MGGGGGWGREVGWCDEGKGSGDRLLGRLMIIVLDWLSDPVSLVVVGCGGGWRMAMEGFELNLFAT